MISLSRANKHGVDSKSLAPTPLAASSPCGPLPHEAPHRPKSEVRVVGVQTLSKQ